ncbi:MAG: lysophospholipid acyltransferase family protein [Gemmatimonadales bacterium]
MTDAIDGAPLGARLGLFALSLVVRPSLTVLIRSRWEGVHHLPRDGCIVCPNHLTEIDPLLIGHLLYSSGIMPYFLAKDSLFRVPLAGRWLRWAGQIPVDRSGTAGLESIVVARRALARKGAIVIYPEGTLTRDPELWPMRGRTGAARLALQTRTPVIPVAHWGAQELLPQYARRLYILPRKTVRVVVGAPVDLDDLAGRPLDRATLEEATARIQDATAALLAPLRGTSPPPHRFDPNAPRSLA